MYQHEMSDDNHVALLQSLCRHPGPVAVSGYACDYTDNLKGWVYFTKKTYAERGNRRTEYLWLNTHAAMQTRMFFEEVYDETESEDL